MTKKKEEDYNQCMPDDAYWKQKLTPEQYHILWEKGTEEAFSGEYWDHHEEGMYHCAGCDKPLFSSKHKFDSGTGWPSFDWPMDEDNVELVSDTSQGMDRTEVLCNSCGGHLGHVFDDGPRNLPDGRQATGKRFCINSAALAFTPKE